MQAVLLAAGESKRFFPYNLKHKCLITVAGDPIIVHTIRAIKRAGITDIIIAVGNDTDFQEVLGNGKRLGVKIRYVVYKDAAGGGETLLKAAHLIDSDFYLINSNHVECDALIKSLDKKRKSNRDAILLAREVASEKHFGVLKVEGDRVLSLVEKPRERSGLSNLRVIGVYFLNKDFIDVLKKEKSHHYSLESAIDTFAKMNRVKVVIEAGEVLSLKYPWDLLNVKNYILKRFTKSISKKASISPKALISGNVMIEEGATVSEFAVIKGPAYIGKNSFVGSNSLVRNGSSLEENSVVGGYMEVKNSLIMKNSKTHSGHFEDSILGEDARVGALFTSANVRLDRKNVICHAGGEEVDSGLRDLGVIIGSSSHLGVRVSTMPGVIIGNHTNIGPSTTVIHNVDSDTSYYTKFAEVIEKKSKH